MLAHVVVLLVLAELFALLLIRECWKCYIFGLQSRTVFKGTLRAVFSLNLVYIAYKNPTISAVHITRQGTLYQSTSQPSHHAQSC